MYDQSDSKYCYPNSEVLIKTGAVVLARNRLLLVFCVFIGVLRISSQSYYKRGEICVFLKDM